MTVAVLGSTVPATLRPAARLGAALARHGAVTLTGGSGPGAGDAAVKDVALTAAADAGGRWVAVDPRGPALPPLVRERGIVLRTGLGHHRNVLNALLCDVAVAFDGGPGTRSEVLACLVVGRPVLLVGWPPGTDEPEELRRSLRGEAAAGVLSGTSELAPWVEAVLRDPAAPGASVERVALDPLADGSDDEVDALVAALVARSEPDGDRWPDGPDDGTFAAAGSAYRAWWGGHVG